MAEQGGVNSPTEAFRPPAGGHWTMSGETYCLVSLVRRAVARMTTTADAIGGSCEQDDSGPPVCAPSRRTGGAAPGHRRGALQGAHTGKRGGRHRAYLCGRLG